MSRSRSRSSSQVQKREGDTLSSYPTKFRELISTDVEMQTYYHYRIHRTDAEMVAPSEGDFIVRKGTKNDPGGYTVSVRWQGRMTHFPVLWVDKQCCFEEHLFPLVSNLITAYSKEGIPVTQKSGAKLINPRPRMDWELLEKELQQTDKLGEGSFGTVFRGKLKKTQDMICAIKTLDKVIEKGEEVLDQARVEMLQEARTMRELKGHPNVIKEIGITIDREQPYAVMEFVDGGSLVMRLRDQENIVPPITKLKCCLDIARGVCYINRSGYIHRDLAARNILFQALPGKGIGICKVSDFGLARKLDHSGCYKGSPNEKFPIVWTALEVLLEGVWHLKSEVWSMGIVIWEVFSNGAMPYCADLQDIDKAIVTKFLGSGKRISPVDDMPPEVERIMNECMITDVHVRPPMSYVCSRLMDELVALVEAPPQQNTQKTQKTQKK